MHCGISQYAAILGYVREYVVVADFIAPYGASWLGPPGLDVIVGDEVELISKIDGKLDISPAFCMVTANKH